MADRHACPDCGASHTKRAPKKPDTRKTLTAATDLTPKRCRHCHTPVIAGRVDAQDIQLDPRPLNAIGIAAMNSARRPIAALRGLRATFINPHIQHTPTPGATWHTIHDCNRPVPHELGDALIDRTRRRANTTLTDNPPY